MSDGNVTAPSATPPVDAASIVATCARQHISNSPYAAVLRGVRCEIASEVVILRGRVSSFYFKQLAQEVARKTCGTRVIVNELQVADRTHTAAANGRSCGESHVRSTEKHGSTEATHGCADTDRG